MPQKTDSLVRLSSETNLTGFDCEDADLNDFLLNDARQYMAELLAVTRDGGYSYRRFFQSGQ